MCKCIIFLCTNLLQSSRFAIHLTNVLHIRSICFAPLLLLLRLLDYCFKSTYSGNLAQSGARKLEEGAQGVVGHVVMGNYSDNGIFVATNATNFPQGFSNGDLRVGISETEECNSDAYGSAVKFPLEKAVTYAINDLGMIEGANGGWFAQPIRELEGNSTLSISLAALINGVADLMGEVANLFNIDTSKYGLAVYLQNSDDELLGCAFLKKHDEETAAEYNVLLNGLSQDQGAVEVKEAPSSASKIGLFVSAIAVVGITVVLGDVLAL